ncbi:MAG: choice-of-anchor R domain-containing protein [Prosthecobacter sp.]|uniref:choice-of-anchor R domain-containing protein n=1 Tax=Prosthecobacter sp. TaxID=1965333 RepID=UPI003903A73F
MVLGGGQLRAVVFTMGSQDYTVDNVILRLGFYSTITDVAQVGFFLDNGSGNIGTQVGSFLSAPPSTNNNVNNFTFTPDGPLTLAASTKYWLLVDGAAAAFDWFGNSPTISPTGSGASFNPLYRHSSDNGVTYATTNLKPSFEINGTAIPEPSRALLAALGLFGLILRRRRA